MLIGMSEATTKIAASATTTAAPPTASGTPGGDQRAEHEDQRERGQRQRDDLAPAQVRLRDGLDVAVEGRAAGELDVERGRRSEALVQDRQGVGRVVRRQVEEDDVVGGVAVGRDLARGEGVRHDPRDVRRASGCRAPRRRRRSRRRACPACEGRAREDDDEGGRRDAELGAEERLRPRRFEVVEDEPARAQPAGQLRRERQRQQEQDGPGADDPAGAAHDESPESIEWGHDSGSPRSARRMTAPASYP